MELFAEYCSNRGLVSSDKPDVVVPMFKDKIVRPEILRLHEAGLSPVASAISVAERGSIRVSGIRFSFDQEYVVPLNFHPKAVREGRVLI